MNLVTHEAVHHTFQLPILLKGFIVIINYEMVIAQLDTNDRFLYLGHVKIK